MTELIVALDTPASIRLMRDLVAVGVRFFKLNAVTLMSSRGITESPHNCDFMLDLKVYDTRDTVALIAERAFQFARFLTVHPTPSMLAAAMFQKRSPYQKVLAVVALTDSNQQRLSITTDPDLFDGIVCSIKIAREIQQYDDLRDKLVICPGIRPKAWPIDNHLNSGTPTEAREAGADYIVMGRPIYEASDPVAAAVAVMEELSCQD